MAKFTIDVLIKGSTNMTKVADSFSKSTKKITAGIDATNKAAKANKAAFAGLSVAASRMNRIVGIGTVAAFAAATHAGAAFEVAIADLSALTGITGPALDTLSDSAIAMSKKYGNSAAKVAEATKLVASAKSELIGTAGALEKVTEQAIILSKASRVDLPTATKVLTTAMNQFNLGAEESARVINVLAVGAKLGASEIADTGQAILRAGVASRVAGISFEQTQAAIQVLAKGGLKGVIAGTQFKTMLLRMMQGSDNLNPKIVGLSKAFENLALAELTGAQYSQLFGLEAMTAGIILTENRELMNKWTKEFTGTNIATEQAARNMATLAEAGKRLLASITALLIQGFNKYGPTIAKMADSTAKFFNILSNPPNKATAIAVKTLGIALTVASVSFSLLLAQLNIWRLIVWSKEMAPAIAAFRMFSASLFSIPIKGTLVKIGALAVSMGTSLVTGVTAATVAVKAFTIALLTNPITWIVLAIVALGAALFFVIKKWDEWGAAVAVMMGPMGLLISTIIQLKRHWSDVTEAFKSGGIKGAILSIGKVLTVAILHPMEQLLNLIAKIPGMGAAGDLAERLGGYQADLFPETAVESVTAQAKAASATTTVPTYKQELELYMKVDSEGKASLNDKGIKASDNIQYNVDLGYTNAMQGAY